MNSNKIHLKDSRITTVSSMTPRRNVTMEHTKPRLSEIHTMLDHTIRSKAIRDKLVTWQNSQERRYRQPNENRLSLKQWTGNRGMGTDSVCRTALSNNIWTLSSFKNFLHRTYSSLRNSVFEVDMPCTWSLVRDCPCHRNLNNVKLFVSEVKFVLYMPRSHVFKPSHFPSKQF